MITFFPRNKQWRSFLPQKARVNTERVPHGHPIILLKSNKFNMAAISVKRCIGNFRCSKCGRLFLSPTWLPKWGPKFILRGRRRLIFWLVLFRARASSKFLSSPLKYRRLLRRLIKVLYSVSYRINSYKLSARRFLGAFGWTFASYLLRLDTIERLQSLSTE